MKDATPSPLDAMTEAAIFVAAMTGIKAQFINAGWSNDAAEALCVAAFQKSTEGTR